MWEGQFPQIKHWDFMWGIELEKVLHPHIAKKKKKKKHRPELLTKSLVIAKLKHVCEVLWDFLELVPAIRLCHKVLWSSRFRSLGAGSKFLEKSIHVSVLSGLPDPGLNPSSFG